MESIIDRLSAESQARDRIRCPFCDFDCSHIRKVYTLLGSDDYEAKIYEGTHIGGHTGDRRSALAIEFDGECGHNWKMIIQQHKGTDFVTYEPL